MNIKVIKTERINDKNTGLKDFLDKYIPKLAEKSIVVVTSKVLSILEGNYLAKDIIDKEDLIFRESDYYARTNNSKYGFRLTISNNMLIPSAGIDESNSFNHYVLLPKDSYKSAKIIWKYLKNKFKLKYLGVIITDSKTTPLRWGTTGISTGYCGFYGLNDYIGQKDIFSREMKVTKSNIVDGLAAGAVAEMGEGSEQTPLAIITGSKQMRFKETATSKKEIEDFKIALEDDLYYPILSRVDWVSNRT